jgi:hypothetical protein
MGAASEALQEVGLMERKSGAKWEGPGLRADLSREQEAGGL